MFLNFLDYAGKLVKLRHNGSSLSDAILIGDAQICATMVLPCLKRSANLHHNGSSLSEDILIGARAITYVDNSWYASRSCCCRSSQRLLAGKFLYKSQAEIDSLFLQNGHICCPCQRCGNRISNPQALFISQSSYAVVELFQSQIPCF